MKKYILAIASIIAICGILAFVAFRSTDQKAVQNQKLPPIISKVKALEVVDATLESPGTQDATVAIKIKNNSPKAILAVAIETGTKDKAFGHNLNGFGEGDVPAQPVVKPFETFVMRMSLASVKGRLPIRVSGVIYADNSEDGEEMTLGSMRRARNFLCKRSFQT